jgi:hypothetical protein
VSAVDKNYLIEIVNGFLAGCHGNPKKLSKLSNLLRHVAMVRLHPGYSATVCPANNEASGLDIVSVLPELGSMYR